MARPQANPNDLKTYCTDIYEWPDSWQYDKPDIVTGEKILHTVFIPFLEFLISKKLTKRTIKRHIDNIWLLGGEIIGRANMDESLREKDGLSLVKEFVDDSGGPYSQHLHSETEMDSLDRSCRKLYKFLKSLDA